MTQGLLAEAQRKLQLAENEKRLLQSRLQTFEDLMSQHGQRCLPPVATLVATPHPLTQPLVRPSLQFFHGLVPKQA